MLKQPLAAKIAEVTFRKKLYLQHFDNRLLFTSEYTSAEMMEIIKARFNETYSDFQLLTRKKILITPFLELGSGYGQASLVLTNKFDAKGYSTDIALSPLLSISKVRKDLNLNKSSKRLVCDIESLPFEKNSVPFIFTYQTIHHLPDPSLVLSKIHETLSPGGVFFVGGEPLSQPLNVTLWRRPTKLRFFEKLLKLFLILPFVSRIGKTEVDHGIIEGDFPLSKWKKAMEIFNEVEIEVQPFPFGSKFKIVKSEGAWKTQNFNFISFIILSISGGGIKAVLKKKGLLVPKEFSPVCPVCYGKLNLKKDYLICSKCKERYIIEKHVPILLKKQIIKKLYPNEIY